MKLALLAALAGLLHCATTATIQAAESKSSSPAQQGKLVDLEGVIHRPFEDPAVRAVVFVFIVPDCPIANSYMPEFNRLHSDYGPRGVRLFLIQVDPQLSLEAARQHAREHQLRPPVVLDGHQLWAQRFGAAVTPEAAVLSQKGKVLYLGRIDDRYPNLGAQRARVTSHDLRDALDAILAGRPVRQPQSKAVGCNLPEVPGVP